MIKIMKSTWVLLLFAPLLHAQEANYTNDSVARMNHLTGTAYIQRASDIGVEECVVNTPITEGDRISTTEGRAEIYIGRGNYVRLDDETKIDVLNLPQKGDDLIRIRVWSGHVYLDINKLAREKSIEIHTPDSSFYLLDEGLYRVDISENKETEILVFRGLAEAAGEDGSILIKEGQRLVSSEGRFSGRPETFMAVANDTFDRWNDTRNLQVSKRPAKRYLPEEMEDFEDELGMSGRWTYLAPYGNVWMPYGIDQEWRPYNNGRWIWLSLTGWTWMPYEPWGWATFHFGRWHWGVDMGWYWIPTSIWGPAWVSWWGDNDYYGWSPLSWWNQPVFIVDNIFYGQGYHDHNRYFDSHALTVIRKDQLRSRELSRSAVRGDELKKLNRSILADPVSSIRQPERLSVKAGESRKILYKKESTAREIKSSLSNADVPSKLSRRESLVKSKDADNDNKNDSKREAVREKNSSSSESGERKSGGERKIRKKDDSSYSYGGTESGRSYSSMDSRSESRVISRRSNYGYPSSSTITSGRTIRRESFYEKYAGSFSNRSGNSYSRSYPYSSSPSSSYLRRYSSSPNSSPSSSYYSSSSPRITSKSSSSRSLSSGVRSSSSSRGSSHSGSRSSGSVRRKN